MTTQCISDRRQRITMFAVCVEEITKIEHVSQRIVVLGKKQFHHLVVRNIENRSNATFG